ncbi:MAG: SurA N-terminal domain-containing protein [Gammaproteobacteria bacterium]|nr:SurA N-terminal domain-containing protein [Gammaproteobacteria bacterium]
MGIQRLRDKTEGIVAKIIVGLIIVVFALFGFGSITTYLAPVAKVATVNRADISQQEMEIAVERNRRIMLAQNVAPQDIDEDALRSNVLKTLINRELLSQETEVLDLEFSDSALDVEIVATEAFQLNGVFDPQQFQLVIGSAGFTPTSYREEMRLDKEFSQLDSAIRGSSFLTRKGVRRASNLAQQTRDIAFLRVDVDQLLDKVVVAEGEIQTYYEANSLEFVSEETVDIEYVELKRNDLVAEVEFDESELIAFYEETRDLYSVGERRRVAHILIEINDDVVEEAAKESIDAIYARVIDGEDFASLAKEFSNDPGSSDEGGDLGFNEPGIFVEEFEAVVNDLSINQVSGPVLTEFGYHVIKLLGVEEAQMPALEEIRDRIEKDFRGSLAEDIFVTRSARLDELAFESQDLVDPAADLDLEIKSTGHVGRTVTEGIAATSAVINAAFSADVLLDGNNSSIIEINSNNHVVVRIKEHKPSEVVPLGQVRQSIREKLLKEKATKLAESHAKEMVAMLESGSITRYVADQYGLKWEVTGEARRNHAGMDTTINREAFSLPKPQAGNKTVGYALLPDGDAAVISVTNVKNKSSDDTVIAGLDSLFRVLGERQGFMDYQAFQDSLTAIADINRVN